MRVAEPTAHGFFMGIFSGRSVWLFTILVHDIGVETVYSQPLVVQAYPIPSFVFFPPCHERSV